MLRYAPSDFREQSLNGIEEDWPLSYEELAPYYDRIEKTIGVCGNDDGLEILAAGPWYLLPPAFRYSEQILKQAGAPLGCDVSAIFSTPSSMLPKAKKKGNLRLRQNGRKRAGSGDSA